MSKTLTLKSALKSVFVPATACLLLAWIIVSVVASGLFAEESVAEKPAAKKEPVKEQAKEKPLKNVPVKKETEGERFFHKKILPVLIKECYECHSSAIEHPKGEFRVDTRVSAQGRRVGRCGCAG